MRETKHGGQRKAVETIHISILSQWVQQADEAPLLAGEEFYLFYFLIYVNVLLFCFLVFFAVVVVTLKQIFVRAYLFRNCWRQPEPFGQPCAGTVTVNLYLTRKIRVDFWTMLFFPVFPRVALFCVASNLSNYFLVTASLLSVQIDVYLARGARQKAWGFFGFVWTNSSSKSSDHFGSHTSDYRTLALIGQSLRLMGLKAKTSAVINPSSCLIPGPFECHMQEEKHIIQPAKPLLPPVDWLQ